ncbi:coiled-coil-helix-coiled-coil-helix domain-containing protein 7 [Vespula pensylvanica]|uniref:Coiled-coil-helix-coiled-coil-helix domain-containing protein 7 n=1 Tax=Vespula pensylvanica TaxID=30213 RepID=A0A834U7B7_VESPE|nr:coiled-coil-helix-coiled-coil-helix domain-containing protein 7 [Vespula pensylvanica]XP_043673537.1 coiled-coil-helix-coiled-coil-helix domain-containing protein 7 [Vespula pensylvanica]XP_043673538.1 coiled-coil-helix-coiled-coil-helix domain-containing protein 7 [Vespula pensylvanica]KAF7419720.1 hypothetical protein H0235_010017 [Vespula pensylvanica]
MNKLNNTNINISKVTDVKRNLRRNHEADNPCLKEYDLSLECLSNNNYIRDACQAYFNNYKICQKFWQKIVADRKLKDIKPYLPSPEDRENIKNEYLKFNIK